MWVSSFVSTVSARSLVSRIAGALCALAAGLLFVCGSASAALTHEYRASFGSFARVQGVAVDSSTEDVYVFDGAANGGSLYKFDSAGAPAVIWGLYRAAAAQAAQADRADRAIVTCRPRRPG